MKSPSQRSSTVSARGKDALKGGGGKTDRNDHGVSETLSQITRQMFMGCVSYLSTANIREDTMAAIDLSREARRRRLRCESGLSDFSEKWNVVELVMFSLWCQVRDFLCGKSAE